MLIFGHRGVRKNNNILSPYQNTIAAFEQAFIEGAEGIELDVVLSKDNNLIVIHDDEIAKHSLNNNQKISELNLSDIKNIKVGFAAHASLRTNVKQSIKGDNLENNNLDCHASEDARNDIFKNYPIPTLEEVLNLLQNKYPQKYLNIELKGQGTAKPVLDLLLNKNFNLEKVIISSFNHKMLHEFCSINSEIKIGVLIESHMLNNSISKNQAIENLIYPFVKYQNFYSINIEDILVPHLKLSPSAINKKIYVWSMSDAEPNTNYINNLAEQNIDCLITDFPEVALKILSKI
jgi:glycerophosphoryl diester phosphodiesterase